VTDTATQNGTTAPEVPANGWVIEWHGNRWTSTETITQQMCAVAELLGVWDWQIARPDAGPRQLVTWIAVLWSSSRDDLPIEESLALVMRQPLAVVVDALTTGS
jgi:hypothetical protein